ncbi:BUD13 homolog isoform X2 [Mastacembelus armatus]|uniref:BUD13 homolog isoform X2 n=1 Tax=Mastacembelus armatus TaxID=205130 RepID=UPI000E45FBCB|nr:BUD13 homolog isoform X2 [Mastacembelus armatus]
MAAFTASGKDPGVSKAEYLKRYLSADEDGKKPKGKLKKKRRKVPEKGLKIVDDDIDWTQTVKEETEIEEDEEEAPVIAEVIDDRPDEVKQLEAFRTSNRWKVIGADEDKDTDEGKEHQSPEPVTSSKSGHDSPELLPKKRRHDCPLKKTRHDSPDVSPPRRGLHDSPDVSPPRRGRHDSPDVSPPRRGLHDSPDVSPPRRGRHDSPDVSPPRRGRHDSPGVSPPRRGRHDSPGVSPPRRGRHDSPGVSPPRSGRHDSPGVSPPRRGRHDSPGVSPPRRGRHDSPGVSPPRRGRHDSPGVSPPRRGRHDSPDVSPPRRGRHDSPGKSGKRQSKDSSPTKGKTSSSLSSKKYPPDPHQPLVAKRVQSRRNSDSDQSPPRKKQQKGKASDQSPPRRSKTRPGSDSDQSPPRRRQHSEKDSDEDLSPPRRPGQSQGQRLLSGGKAGLISVDILRKEQEENRRRERNNQSLEDESRNVQTVFRDKSGKRRDLDSEREEQKRKAGEKAAKDEKYALWGKGLAQTQMYQQKLEDALHEAQKPLARHYDDEDLDRMLREREREGDPMAAMLRRKKGRNIKTQDKPQYKGPAPPPNRFNLLPGYRWDGVDRSNGFEQKRYMRMADKKASQEAAYKWSVEDM